jgi:hypothetical protein
VAMHTAALRSAVVSCGPGTEGFIALPLRAASAAEQALRSTVSTAGGDPSVEGTNSIPTVETKARPPTEPEISLARTYNRR